MKPVQTEDFAILSAIALVILAGLPAAARASGWYLGANAGEARAKIDEPLIVRNLLATGFATTAFTADERDFGYKVFGGYRFNRYLALEGGYFDLGQFNFEASTAPAGTLHGEIKVRGADLDLVGFIPFTEKFAAFARGGAIYAESRDSFAGTGAVNVLDPSRRERDTKYKFGLGLQYRLTRSFTMRVEAERYRINDAVGNEGDIDLLSLGVLFGFGEPPAQPAPAPALPAAIPEPTPPPPSPLPSDSDQDGVNDDIDKCPGTAPGVATDATGCPLKGSIALEGVTFEFNSALLTAESRSVLERVAIDLKKYRRLRIELQGHTDNVGSDSYNRALSQRRAESVRAYLIDRGVSADRLTARGYGEARPIDRNDTDAGRARNRRAVMDVIANPGEVKIEGEGSARY